MLTQQERTVVVLGAAGFVGRHACRALSRHGVRVVGLGHGHWHEAQWRSWGLSAWHAGDIETASLDGLALSQAPAAVIHCAGSGAVSHAYAQPFDDYQRAVQTTAAVLEWARRGAAPTCRVVLVSSAAVYGDQGDVDASETTTRSPISPYGFHKLAAETMCDSYSRFFDVPVTIVRLFSVYGEGLKKQLLWDALAKFSRGENRFLGTGHELRDWLHVSDAAELLVAASLEEQEPFEVYNGGGTHATTRQILEALANEICTPLQPVFSGETHVGNPRRLTANNAHSRRQLGWTPKVTLEQGLAAYARWHREAKMPGTSK